MTSGDGTAGATRVCKNPECGRSFVVGIRMRERQPQLYCVPECRSRAARARCEAKEAARREAARAAVEPRACVVCAQPFTPKSRTRRTCGDACFDKDKQRITRERNAASRALIDASKAAPPKPAPTVCPDCGKPARRATDARNLVYCTYRCGWSVLLTAKERDVREGTADPTPDDDQEEEMSAEEDLDTETTDETTEEEAPASESASPWGKKRAYRKQRATEATAAAVLAAITRGVIDPLDMQGAAGLSKTAVYRSLELLLERGQVVRRREGKKSYYPLAPSAPVAVEPAPIAQPPAPVRNASVTPAPASLRAQIAALPPGELLDLIDALAPVAAHARALAAALAGLRGQP